MISDRTDKSQSLQEKIAEEMLQESKLAKQIKTQTNKLGRSKELVKAINYSLDNFFNYDPAISSLKRKRFNRFGGNQSFRYPKTPLHGCKRSPQSLPSK